MLARIEGGHQRLVLERHSLARGRPTMFAFASYMLILSIRSKSVQTGVFDVFLEGL